MEQKDVAKESSFVKYFELYMLLLFGVLIIAVPGYLEKFPSVLVSERGMYFICTFIGVSQFRALLKSRRARAVIPVCIVALVLSVVGFIRC